LVRTAAALAALLGGLAWVAAYGLDRTDRVGPANAVELAGLVLLVVAALAAGAGLVSRSATWLRVVVSVCFVLLLASVLEVLADGIDERLVQAGAGGLAGIVGIVVLSRGRPAPAPQPGGHRARGGSHAR
jgi:hypothetical protein